MGLETTQCAEHTLTFAAGRTFRTSLLPLAAFCSRGRVPLTLHLWGTCVVNGVSQQQVQKNSSLTGSANDLTKALLDKSKQLAHISFPNGQ